MRSPSRSGRAKAAAYGSLSESLPRFALRLRAAAQARSGWASVARAQARLRLPDLWEDERRATEAGDLLVRRAGARLGGLRRQLERIEVGGQTAANRVFRERFRQRVVVRIGAVACAGRKSSRCLYESA
jgi:hypothetical protein